jgi:hypothetical protein
VIDNAMHLEILAKLILSREDVSFVNSYQDHAFCGTYIYDSDISIPEDICNFNNEFRMWHFIPIKWNEKDIDVVELVTYGKIAALIGVQITLESPQQHVSSLCWFRSNLFETLLKSCGYDEVRNILLFICNGLRASDLKCTIAEAIDKPVFDYPLYGIIPDILDKKNAISSAKPSIRRLNLRMETAGKYLRTHADLENASMHELRSFWNSFGDCNAKFKRKEEGRQIAYEIHR